MFTVIVQLATAGSDTGPLFNLYSNVDGYSSAFETGVTKLDLLAGYTSYLVPDGTTIIRVCSTGPDCFNCVDIPVASTTTSSTSTIAANTEITIINNTESVTFDSISMSGNPLLPGPFYPTPGNTYLTSYPSGTYSVTVTLLNVPNSNTTIRIDDGDIIQCYTFPTAGLVMTHTFPVVSLTGAPATITINSNPC